VRREFSKQVKRDAFVRAAGLCEGANCGAKLMPGKFHYDHDIADGLGASLNCGIARCSAMPATASKPQSTTFP
jgi:hypothetical protein